MLPNYMADFIRATPDTKYEPPVDQNELNKKLLAKIDDLENRVKNLELRNCYLDRR